MGLYLESHARTASMMVGSGSNPDDRIIIDNFPGGDAAFSQIIDHCYSYEPIINASNAVQLFYAADYFCMSEFQSRIQDFIEDFFFCENESDPSKLVSACLESFVFEIQNFLPNTFSQIFMNEIAKQMKKGNEVLCITLSQFLNGEFNAISNLFIKYFCQSLPPKLVSCSQTTNGCIYKMISRNLEKVTPNDSKFDSDVSTASTVNAWSKILMNSLNPSFLPGCHITALLEKEEILFEKDADGLLYFIINILSATKNKRFGNLTNMDALSLSRKVLNVSKKLFLKENNSENSRMLLDPAKLFEILSMVISMLLYKFGLLMLGKNDTLLEDVLFNAISDDNATAVEGLLDAGASPNASSSSAIRKTALQHAIIISAADNQGSFLPPCIRLLLKAGSDPNQEDKHGSGALHWLCHTWESWEPENNCFSAILDALLAHGADLNKVNANGCTPLHLLCLSAKDNIPFASEAIKLLLKRNADPNIPLQDGNTPLHSVACGGPPEIVQCLLSAGADHTKVNKMGKTPLHAAENCTKTRDSFTITLLKALEHG